MIQPLEILAQAINIICKNQDRCFWPRILHILEEICELTLCVYFKNDPDKVPLNYIQYLQLSHHAHLGLIPLLSVILVLFRETSKGIKTRINKRQLQAKLSFPYIVLLFKLKQLRNHGSISDFIQFSLDQSLSCVRHFATPWTATHQASLSSPTPGVHPNPCPLSQ